MQRAAGPGVRIAALATGVVVQAGAAPDRGSRDSFANRDQMRSVHRLLAPIARLDLGFNRQLDAYPGNGDAWHVRFLDPE
jgi:hypothetical protein